MAQKLTFTIRNKTYNLVVCAIVLLLVSAGLVTKIPFTENVARAAAKFLTSVTHDASLTGDGTNSAPLGIANNGVGTSQLANGAITAPKIASGQVVKSINGLTDDVTLAAGSNISLALTGQTLTIAANVPAEQSTPQPYINPHRVAALQWYEAIQTGLQYPAPAGTN